MRTTLNIDDDLYRFVKLEAVRRGVTATSVIEDALRSAMRLHRETVAPEFPVSARTGGLRPGVNLQDSDQLYEMLYADDDRRATAMAMSGIRDRLPA